MFGPGPGPAIGEQVDFTLSLLKIPPQVTDVEVKNHLLRGDRVAGLSQDSAHPASTGEKSTCSVNGSITPEPLIPASTGPASTVEIRRLRRSRLGATQPGRTAPAKPAARANPITGAALRPVFFRSVRP